jgi:hydrogenase maturation protease
MPAVLMSGTAIRYASGDGAGWIVAEELRRRLAPAEVEVVRLQQLLPEVAESVSRAETAIFVDASRDGEPGDIHCQPVAPPPTRVEFSHQLSPAEVLGLACQLHGATPQALYITPVGERFEHGEGLPEKVAAGLPLLAAEVEQLTKQILSGPLAFSLASQEDEAVS